MNDLDNVYILGIGVSDVGRFPHRSFTDIASEAITKALTDATLEDVYSIDHLWFSNYMMDSWGQRAGRGNEALGPLLDDGPLAPGTVVANVEAACASGSVAFNSALNHVRSGSSDIALAVGVEKMNPAGITGPDGSRWLADGIGAIAGVQNRERYFADFHHLAAKLDTTFDPVDTRSFAMDVYALWALDHMATYGTDVAEIAAAAAKNHTNAVGNPRAQYRFPMTADQVLSDRMVATPLTRAMCAPAGDAGAAVLVCSESYLRRQPSDVQHRALHVRGHALAGGRRGLGWEEPRAPVRAAAQAYEQAGIGPDAVDVVELHDATSFAEIHLVEDLGLCSRGAGGAFTASGATARDGEVAVNPSGGLVSRGHPIGATGIMMLNEVALQLRGEAEAIQVPDAHFGLAENGGGFIGNDVSVCSVTILTMA